MTRDVRNGTDICVCVPTSFTSYQAAADEWLNLSVKRSRKTNAWLQLCVSARMFLQIVSSPDSPLS
jgi:hypothetical protein